TNRLEQIHCGLEIRFVAPAERILNDDERCPPANRLGKPGPRIVIRIVNVCQEAADAEHELLPGCLKKDATAGLASVGATISIWSCRKSTAECMSPNPRQCSASCLPASSAEPTNPAASCGTSTVTRRSPKSVLGSKSIARARRIPEESTFTALAISVAAASAAAPFCASTVTLSAIPRLKLRPRQPLVAMPRIGDEASNSIVPSSSTCGDPLRATQSMSATTPTR